MNLFEKVEEFKGLDNKIKELDKEIREAILTKFVNLRYHIKEVEVGYPRHGGDQTEKIKVYYPILDLPEGFSKKDDEFFRQYANQIVHTYTLTDTEGKQVKIEEIAGFKIDIYDDGVTTILVNSSIVSKDIVYKVYISESICRVTRVFAYREMIEQIVEDKEKILTCKEAEEIYYPKENAYEEYLKSLGKTDDIIPLKELVRAPKDEIEITPTLFAKIKIEKGVSGNILWLENSKIQVRNYIPYYDTYIVEVEIRTATGSCLASKKFKYSKLKDRFKQGIPLNEFIKLIKE